MQITSIPLIQNNEISAIRLKVKNITPTEEIMAGGKLSLVFRYTPAGGNPDGSNDIFVRVSDVECDELQFEDEKEYCFDLPEDEFIPVENYDSIQCVLVFKDTFGDEIDTAVIGKSFAFGEIKFNEGWDNGLEGNHTPPWYHNWQVSNSDLGDSSTTINNGALIKENIRYIGCGTPCFNDSFIDLVNDNNPNGVLITPNTYLQFKINEMSINEMLSASSGQTVAWQFLMLKFNTGLRLEYSQEGQFIDMVEYNQEGQPIYTPTKYYSFEPGECVVDNIYDLFLVGENITIPEPLYLKRIWLDQGFTYTDNPIGMDNRQHMKVDYIRIIETKQQ